MEDNATKRYLTFLLFALLVCFSAAALAEEAPAAVHDDTHRVTEREHGQPQAMRTDSGETHAWITAYDLYCEDCGRVIEENVRTEEKQEPHAWSVTRQEPTCAAEGWEKRACPVCGAAETETLPALDHDWSEWAAVPVPEDAVCVADQMEERECLLCGRRESRVVSPAPGHQWMETIVKESSCTEAGEMLRECQVCPAAETVALPALGHSFASVSALVKRDAGAVLGEGENEGLLLGYVNAPSTCTEIGSGTLLCLRCGQEGRSVSIPAGGHAWTEWEPVEIPGDQICVTDACSVRRCPDCGLEETEVTAPAPGHQWVGVSFTEPTCMEPGRAVRRCAVCQTEEIMETPALGHCYMWMDVKQPNGVTVSEYVCSICGDVAQRHSRSAEQMYYNNTISSFGPQTRELIGGGVWNRVTPLNLAEEGMFTYPLIASNLYTVGPATVINEKGVQTITYKLNSNKITVHTESLVIYPGLEALRTGENAVAVEFGKPVELSDYFGVDQNVLMAITLTADYDANAPGIQYFQEDEALIGALSELID